MTPNLFAQFMLIVWPFVAIVLFRTLPIERAFIWTILAGYLLLPPNIGFDLPAVPTLDKTVIPNLIAAAAVVVILGGRLSLIPKSNAVRLLVLFFVVSPFVTVLGNSEPILFDVGGRPGLRPYDALSAVANQFIYVLPFFLARSLLASEAAQRDLVLALVVAGLAYSLPMLLEIRLSPQLNIWVYGYFPHRFEQQIRFGGFRPVVFLAHGIWVAFFALMGLLAAAVLARSTEGRMRAFFLAATGYLAVVLVLCKTVGAIVYAVALLPLVFLTSRRFQVRVALLMAMLAITYPLLRGADLIPVDAMLQKASLISAERAQSLEFRFTNEAMLLDHASEKPLFGWGQWGRNLVYDPFTGRSSTTADGRWVITIGTFGWLGYLAEFGLMALPILLVWSRTRRISGEQISPYAAGLCVILAVNMVDLLPNATLTPLTWLIAGALLGYAEALKTRPSETEADAQPGPENKRSALAYARRDIAKTGSGYRRRRPEAPIRERSPQ